MAKLPLLPNLDRLGQLKPALIQLAAGTEVARIYFRGGPHPTHWNALRYFGPTSSRFDHHLLDENGRSQIQERGVIYLATNALSCFAEVFQYPARTIHRRYNDPWLVVFALQATLTLLDLRGRFSIRAGASMKLVSGPTAVSRNWARDFYDCYPTIQGFYYPSSMTNQAAIVLNERAEKSGVFPPTPQFHRALNDPVLLTPLRNAAADLGYDLI